MSSEHDAVVTANHRFYEAFAQRDLVAMDMVWACDAPVTCIHPGWGLLDDRGEIMASWQGIFADDTGPMISCKDPQVQILGQVATVVCLEHLGHAVLIATNLFIREKGQWRLTHHHAGPVMRRSTKPPTKDGELLN